MGIHNKIFPVLLLIRITGLFPYDSKFQLSFLMSIVSIILICTPLGIFTYYIMTAEAVESAQDELMVIVNKFLIFLYIVVIVTCFTYQKRFRITMSGFDTFDAWMSQSNVKANDKLLEFWIFYIFNCLLVTGILAVSYTDYELPFSSFEVSFWVMWLVIDLHMKKLQIILSLAESRFSVLTKCITDKPDRFVEFLNLYGILERVSTSANQMFSILLVVHTLVSWMSFLTESYAVVSLLISMLSKNHERRQYNIYMVLMTSTFFFFQLFTLAYQRERTAEKASEFNKILYHIALKDKFKGFYQHNYVLMHLAKKKQIYLSASGFFNLDFRFVQSIVLTSSTYLVVLIQFYVESTNSNNSTLACTPTNVSLQNDTIKNSVVSSLVNI